MKNILIKPLITEKFTQLGDKLNKFAFVVDKGSNKIEIKKAVEEMYGVTVLDVNTSVRVGKQKSRYTKTGVISGKTSVLKRAIVTVAEGDTIDFYSNI
ncbi:MAG: 50S ribosomal protein L23 [Chitinophagaceae bacterium]|nr:MAG: 50S ribosomal protein L23 [Chitinophagaceae bacterium]